jgi:hypothetical protein
MLTDIIAKTTRMSVEEVKSDVAIQPGCQVSKKPD